MKRIIFLIAIVITLFSCESEGQIPGIGGMQKPIITESSTGIGGQYMVAAVYLGYLYTSDDYGATWTQKTTLGTKKWEFPAISRDGQYQLIGVYGSTLYLSSDYGGTWAQANTGAGNKNYQGVAISATGQYMVAAAGSNYLYTSDDYGATWTQKTTLGIKSWQAGSMSSNGQYQLFAAYSGGAFLSTDYGSTWARTNSSTGTNQIRGASVSSDGSYMVMTDVTAEKIYYSTDYGATWSDQSTPAFAPWIIDISATGQYQIARGDAAENFYFSNDYGATFLSKNANIGFQNACITDDGSYSIIADYGGYVYFSDDYGANYDYYLSLGVANWFGIALSK